MYNQHDHTHCWKQDSPPCGQKIKHFECCLCKKEHPEIEAERQKREEVVEAERERWMKAVKFLHSDLKQDGMYDGKVSSDFISGWKDALQWLATSMHPNQIVSKDLEITHPNNPKT